MEIFFRKLQKSKLNEDTDKF